MATLKDRVGEEVQYFMTGGLRILLSSILFGVVCAAVIIVFPAWRPVIIDALVIATASVTMFFVVPTVHRNRRLFLLFKMKDKVAEGKQDE